ncbi:MAG: ABC transporter permease [Candidatus Latescibacterota bacterium]|jgi:ABC-2 type transport system permease protein
MSLLREVYPVLFRTDLAVQFQYRAAMIIWLIGLVIQPVVYLVVWLTVAKTQGGEVGGFTGADFSAYYITYMVVNHLTFTWVMFEFEYRVRSGAFSPLLLQPLHPIHRDIATNIAYKLLTTVLVVPVTALLIWAFSPRAELHLWALLAFIPSLILAFLLRFFIEWALALAAFWTTRVDAINQVFFAVMLFLAGRMAPLALMPDWVQTIAYWSPFPWMVAFPVDLLLGKLTWEETIEGLVAQAVWSLLALALLNVVWKRGVKAYSAVGS